MLLLLVDGVISSNSASLYIFSALRLFYEARHVHVHVHQLLDCVLYLCPVRCSSTSLMLTVHRPKQYTTDVHYCAVSDTFISNQGALSAPHSSIPAITLSERTERRLWA